MRYIVTGATGHLGNTLIKKLTQEGHYVRALVLKGEAITPLLGFPHVDIIYGDVTIYESLLPLFENLNMDEEICLIHTAGIISISDRKPKLMQKVNIEGTKNILRLIASFPINHFIYISSVHAIQEPASDTIITETLTFDENSVHGAYAKTKAAATKLVIETYKKGQSTTIIHPSGIIGPFDFGKSHMTALFEAYYNGKLNARINGEYDFVDVRDVVEAIYTASLKKAQGPYLITGHRVALRELFETMRLTAGFKRKPVVFARWFVKIFLNVLESRAIKRGKTPLFTRYSLYTLTTHCRFSYEKAAHDLNYKPRPLNESILDTARWLVDQKRVYHKKTIRYILNKVKLS
ncbi:MAG: NAD-dependent epimerase/dehydratase family protein [Bacilli bacterium]